MKRATAASWVFWAIGTVVCLLGFFSAVDAFRLMVNSKPTGASLTLGIAVVQFALGVAALALGVAFRRKETSR